MNSKTRVESQVDKEPEVFQRADKRKLDEYRLIKLTFERGSCIVTLGDTQIVVQLFVSIVRPNYLHPCDGKFQINLNFAGQSTSSTETKNMKELLERFYKNSNFIDLKALCILAGEEVWKLVVDLNVLTMDGNVIGCSSIAIIAALMYFRDRDVDSVEENLTDKNTSKKLFIIYHFPVITSFAIFKNGDVVLDPSLVEENECESKMFVCFNDQGKLCGVDKGGCVNLNHVHYMNCLNNAATITLLILDHIKSAMDNATKDRTSAHSLKSTVVEDCSLKLCLSDRFKSVELLNEDNKYEEKTDSERANVFMRDNRLIVTNDPHTFSASDDAYDTDESEIEDAERLNVFNNYPYEFASSNDIVETDESEIEDAENAYVFMRNNQLMINNDPYEFFTSNNAYDTDESEIEGNIIFVIEFSDEIGHDGVITYSCR